MSNSTTHEFRRHAIHKFAELGSIGVPQSAHNTRCTGGVGTNSIVVVVPNSEQKCLEIHYKNLSHKKVLVSIYLGPVAVMTRA